MKAFLSLLLAFIATHVGTALQQYSGFNFTNATLGSTSANTNLMTNYSCVLQSLWTQSRQPASFPANAAFFSPMIVAHSSSYTLWAAGTTASQGLNSMVITGATDRVINEVNGAGEAVLGYEQGTSQNVLLLVQQTLPSIQVDKDRSYLTTVTPFSPSPDWFNGFYKFNTIDSGTNTFFESFTIDVFAWDLGTKSGDTYNSIGSSLSPYNPIKEFTVATIPSSDVFFDSSRTQVLPVASWTCNLQLGEALVAKVKTSAATPTASTRVLIVVGTLVGLLLPFMSFF